MTGISANHMERLAALENRVEVYAEVLNEFSYPISTGRSPDGGDHHPEKDIMDVRVEMKTWFKMKILLGQMTVESVRNLIPRSRPSEKFIKELEEFEERVSA